MKRLVSVLGLVALMSWIPLSAQAITPSPSPSRTHTPKPGHTETPVQKAAREAARATYRLALTQAQNGRDLAFADANATLMQSLQTAGKDKAARLAARTAYKSAATGIITAYKQSIETARQVYKTALLTISGK